jgi:hypothetical protein
MAKIIYDAIEFNDVKDLIEYKKSLVSSDVKSFALLSPKEVNSIVEEVTNKQSEKLNGKTYFRKKPHYGVAWTKEDSDFIHECFAKKESGEISIKKMWKELFKRLPNRTKSAIYS